jgi:hypothetical protein
VVVNARLVEDHVRELGQAVLYVLHPPRAHDARPVVRVGSPEHRLVHPVGLGDELLAEPERLEHLHRAAGDTVGLAELERTGLSLDNARCDRRELGELGGEHQSRRTTSNDQHVDLVRQGRGPCNCGRIGRPDARVASPESVHVELHRQLLRALGAPTLRPYSRPSSIPDVVSWACEGACSERGRLR